MFLLEYPEHVAEFERDLGRTGMSVVFSDEEVSVIDTIPGFDRRKKQEAVDNLERTLHFNKTLDFIQTSVNVDATTKAIHHNQPLNLETANHIIAMSLSLVLHFANQPLPAAPSSHLHSAVKRCVVLGAGGCIFPIILSSLLPRDADIHAVELSPSIIHAALQYFSVSPYVSNLTDFPGIEATTPTPALPDSHCVGGNKFKLHSGCGIEWLSSQVAQHKAGTFDMIFVDIFDGDIDSDLKKNKSRGGGRITEDRPAASPRAQDGGACHSDTPDNSELYIPSVNIINKKNILLFAEALSSEGGLLAINTVGNLEALAGAAAWLDRVLNQPSAASADRFHVGYMKVPIVLTSDSEDVQRGAGQEKEKRKKKERGIMGGVTGFVRRDNIVLFVIKNPSVAMTSVDLAEQLRSYLALAAGNQARPQSAIPLPFANEMVEPFVAKWVSLYETVNDGGFNQG